MRNLDKMGCTPTELLSRDIAPDEKGYHSGEISNVLTQSMPQLRNGKNECSAVSDLKAIFIGLTQRPRHVTAYFVEGVCWTVTSLKSADQAIGAIGKEEIDYVFISIQGVDEFAPSVVSRIRCMQNAIIPKIIAFDNYVPKYLSENLIHSGVDKVVICHRLQERNANHSKPPDAMNS